MADPRRRLPANVAGDFFVDATCIDCDACRQIAPATFRAAEGQSAVWHQPETAAERHRAAMALVACPTGSIGGSGFDRAAVLEAFPAPVADEVFVNGFTSESSFGAFSYLVRRPDGNVMIDVPRFARPLVRNLERTGGIAEILLTHRDDVADHAAYAAHFGAGRVLHAADVTSSTRAVERQPAGSDAVDLGRDLRMIPTPGHTRGHAVYLYRDTFLFTGEHLAWSPRRGHLYAFRDACWYSWDEQIASMERLLEYGFEWVLPGHGRPVHLPPEEMRRSLERCIEWMKTSSRSR